MFLRRFPTIMDNQLSIDWDTILGVYNRMPFFPITLIDTEILDNWATHPSIWEVKPKRRHSRRVLAMVCYTLLAHYKGQVAVVFGASFVLILSYQVHTSLSNTLSYLKYAKEDCVVLVSTPSKLTYSPQPWGGKPYTLLPISSNPNVDRGPLHSFVAATLLIASREGHGSEMPVCVKLLPCFGSSKRVRMELLWEPSLLRGLLWKNTHFIERNASGVMVPGLTGKPLCQELMVNFASPGGRMEYTSTERGCPTPLTLVASPPGWDDYLDLGETVTEMANRLMEEDGQQVKMPPKADTTPKQKDITQVKALPPSDNITMLPDSAFPSFRLAGSSCDNPVHLSDTTDVLASGSRPTKDTEMEDEAMVLSHFSDALSEMAASIIDLENGYLKALHEVIIKTEKALCDVSHIDAHYVSHVVTVMTSWQEAVQAATSHMEGVDTTTYLTHREDARRVTHEYVKEVVKAHEEHNAAHKEEQKEQIEAIKADDFEDPVVCLLHVTHKAARARAEKAVDAFLSSIKSTLHKHIAAHAQGPLIANALSTAFQFQMSMWCMIGEECVHPMWAKHSDWCGLAGIVQAIVETLPKNCALMIPPPPAPMPPKSFSSTFRPASSDEDDDNDDDTLGAKSFRRFNTSSPAPSVSGHGSASSFSHTPSFTSTPLPHGGAFRLVSDPKEMPSSAAGMPPGDEGVGG